MVNDYVLGCFAEFAMIQTDYVELKTCFKNFRRTCFTKDTSLSRVEPCGQKSPSMSCIKRKFLLAQ